MRNSVGADPELCFGMVRRLVTFGGEMVVGDGKVKAGHADPEPWCSKDGVA